MSNERFLMVVIHFLLRKASVNNLETIYWLILSQ